MSPISAVAAVVSLRMLGNTLRSCDNIAFIVTVMCSRSVLLVKYIYLAILFCESNVPHTAYVFHTLEKEFKKKEKGKEERRIQKFVLCPLFLSAPLKEGDKTQNRMRKVKYLFEYVKIFVLVA